MPTINIIFVSFFRGIFLIGKKSPTINIKDIIIMIMCFVENIILTSSFVFYFYNNTKRIIFQIFELVNSTEFDCCVDWFFERLVYNERIK